MAFLLRSHFHKEGKIVAVCDSDLLGKRFEEGESVLYVSEKFFGGQEATVEEIKERIREALTSNVVGNGIVNELLKAGAIDERGVGDIAGVKYAHFFRIL